LFLEQCPVFVLRGKEIGRGEVLSGCGGGNRREREREREFEHLRVLEIIILK